MGAWQQKPVFKTNISQFSPIRTINAKVPRAILRKISLYFTNPSDEYKFDPSYEFTNDPEYKIEPKEPYADPENVSSFKELQLFESVGLVEPAKVPNNADVMVSWNSLSVIDAVRKYAL